jgi:plastocyanin
VILVVAACALGAAPARADQAVTILDCGGFCHQFSPSVRTSAPSETVTWTSQSTAPHTVTRCTPAACNGADGGTGADSWSGTSAPLNNGDTYHTQFTGQGTYVYYCTIHGYVAMHGTITVSGSPPPPPPTDTPVAAFTATPAAPAAGQTVSFDGSASSDADGEPIATYHWNFGDGVTQTSSTAAVTHAYATAGSYPASLSVVDSTGHQSAQVSHTVTVGQPAPPPPYGPPPGGGPPGGGQPPGGQPAGGQPNGGQPNGGQPKPVLTKLHLSARRLCATRSRACTRTKTRFTFTLSSAAKVELTIRRGRRVLKKWTLHGKAGRNIATLSAAGLKPGSYVLVATASAGAPLRVTFGVSRSR